MTRDTQYFTVFGSAYVPERHYDSYRFDVAPNTRAHRPDAASWLVLCSLMIGISVFAAQIAAAGTHGLF